MRILLCIGASLFLATNSIRAQAPQNSASAPQEIPQSTILELNKPIERELHGAETHTYIIHANAGQFFHVVVLQKGIDVAVTLLDPNNQKLAVMDSFNGAFGPEPVSAIAEISGDFRVQIAGGGSLPGKYEVSLTDVRIPVPSDSKRIGAERAYMSGMNAFMQGDAKSYHSAAEKWQESFELWQSLDDKYGEAISLYSAGSAFHSLRDEQKALELFDKSLALMQAMGDFQGEGTTLNNLGLVLDALGNRDKALEQYNKALPKLRAAGDIQGEASVLNNLGLVYHSLGDGAKELDYLNQALAVFRKLNDRSGEGTALNNIALAYSRLGEKRKALEYLSQALPLRRAAGDRDGEGIVLMNIGAVNNDLGERQKALEYYRQALPLLESAGDRIGQAQALNLLGTAYSNMGENQKALDYYDQALKLIDAVGARPGLAVVLNNIGSVYRVLGELQKALDYYSQALTLHRAVGDRAGEAATLTNLGLVHQTLGENEKALGLYTQALEIARAVHNPEGEAQILNNIGGVYDNLGDRQKALEFSSEAVTMFHSVHDPSGEARSLTNMAMVYSDLGEKKKALDLYAQALPLRRALNDKQGEATTLHSIGLAYSDLGDLKTALDYFKQALPLRLAAGDREGEARTLREMGVVYAALGEKQEALENFDKSLSLSQSVKDPIDEEFVLLSLMNYWKTERKLSVAIYFGKQAIDRVQEMRRNIAGLPREVRQGYLKTKENQYRDVANLLVQEGRLAEAQEVLDLLKVEEYSEYSHYRGAPDSSSKPVAFTRTEESAKEAGDPIEREVIALGQRWSELNRIHDRTPEQQERYEELSEKLNEANLRMNAYFRSLYEYFGKDDQANRTVETVKGQSSGLRNLLREMSPGTVALYTLVLEDKCVVIVITPATMVARDVPVTRAILRAKVFAFKGAIAGRQPEQDLLPKAADLYKILIGPIEKDLEQAHANTLVWSLDDVLRYVPLPALHDGRQYLTERFSTVVLTTASLGNLREQPQVAAWRGLAMGVSKDYDGLGELSAVPSELDAVVTSATVKSSHGPVQGAIMLNDSFTEKGMEAALDQPPPLVHIATHFVFNPGDDQRSYLLLGGEDTGGKGYHLSLADFRDRQGVNLAGVELLTLSGCDTATGSKANSDGREVDSLGIVGQMKGAKAVVATLWKVDDASVGVFMGTFYRLWTTKPGMSKAEALRLAQLSLLRGSANPAGDNQSPSVNQATPYANPYYWAPFVLMGNWK